MALGEIKDQKAVDPLIKTLKVESDSDFRKAAAEALEKIGTLEALKAFRK